MTTAYPPSPDIDIDLHSIDETLAAADGLWDLIIPATTGLSEAIFTQTADGHPCPLCHDETSVLPSGEATLKGCVRCRNCTCDVPTQHGVQTISIFAGVSLSEAARLVQYQLMLRSDETNEQHAADERPEVIVTLDESRVANEVVACLGGLGWAQPSPTVSNSESSRLFVRGGVLVQAVESEDPVSRGSLMIRRLPQCITRERITQACRLINGKVEAKATRGVRTSGSPMPPPKWLVESVQCRGNFNGKIRSLVGIIHSPTIRADGSILQVAGYDDATCLIYRPSAVFPLVPENPTRDDARNAIECLFEVVSDFPMMEEADLAAWVAYVLTLIGRPAISGCTPLFAFTANSRGAGKSLMADAAAIVANGRPSARQPFTRNEAEQKKAITSVLLEGIPNVLFDNVDGEIGGAPLDGVLTGEIYRDRILGSSSTTGDLPSRTVWAATGNNLAFGSDISRRVLPIRLQTPLESPENRTGFAHDDLLAWVTEYRPTLAVSALTILRAYFVAGCPSQAKGAWGSFEGWSRLVRNAVVWLGVADPLATRVTATANDESKNLLALIIAGLEEADSSGVGLTTREIEVLTTPQHDYEPQCESLVAAVREICFGRFSAKSVGKAFSKFVDRPYEGRQIHKGNARGGVARWSVRPATGLVALVGLDASRFNSEHLSSQVDHEKLLADSGPRTESEQPKSPKPTDSVLHFGSEVEL